MAWKFLLIFSAFLATIYAGPLGVNSDKCSTTCGANKKFAFEAGRTYEYAYETKTQVSISISDQIEKRSEVDLKASVQIYNAGDCDFVLKLTNVELGNSKVDLKFNEEVTRNSLKFGFDDGKITSVCADPEEKKWVLNFKKSLLSNLQISMETLYDDQTVIESDATGTCETTYKVVKEGKTIKKTKTPTNCANKSNFNQKFSTFGFSLDKLAKNIPLVQSEIDCVHNIENDVIQNVECRESGSALMPYSDISSAAIKATTRLGLVNSYLDKYELSYGSHTEKQSLELTENDEEKTSDVGIDGILSNLEESTKNGVGKETPAQFSSLVEILKSLSYDEIKETYEKQTSESTKKIILDALPLVNTANSIQFFVDLITRGDISTNDAKTWFASLALVENPTLQMISALQRLLNSDMMKEGMLRISSFIYNYCSNNQQCHLEQPVQAFLRFFESKLISCDTSSSEEKEIVLLALKSIGNVGRILNAESALKKCATGNNRNDVRVSAIQSYRRMTCDGDRQHLDQIFMDSSLDSEIRIEAYLGLMKCASEALVDRIREYLSLSEVDHVASFVWTHLANLQESAAPEKQWIRLLIGEENLQKKFSAENLKFSKNFESSFYLTESKFGANYDSNVIFSDQSVIPRSLMLNLTTNLFGENVNLFEIGGRMEGMEGLIEKFFGPNGYYPEETLANIMKNLKFNNDKSKTSPESIEKDPAASMYLKIFGSEIFYKDFSSVDNFLNELKVKNPMEMLRKLAKGEDIDYVKNFEDLNANYKYVSITGFPIKFNIKGTGSVGFKLNGEFNFENFKKININGKLHPSVSLTVESQLAVDSFVSKNGLKTVSNIHSSTLVEGKFVVDNGKVIDIEVKVPQEKIEILDSTNEVFDIVYGEEKALKPSDSSNNCAPLFLKVFGMQICSSNCLRYTDYFYRQGKPFQSNFNCPRNVYLLKTDTHTSYKFKLINEPTRKLITFDMPGSRSNKKWILDINTELHNLKADLKSPYGSADFYLFYDRQSVQSQLNFNDRKMYELSWDSTKNEVGNRITKSKFIVGNYYDTREMINLNMAVKCNRNEQLFKLDADIDGSLLTPAKLQFNINYGREFEINGNLKSRLVDLVLSSKLKSTYLRKELNTEVEYRYQNMIGTVTPQIVYKMGQNDEKSQIILNVPEIDLNSVTSFRIAENDNSFNSNGNFGLHTWTIENEYEYKHNPKEETQKLYVKQVMKIPTLGINNEIYHYSVLSNEHLMIQKSARYLNRKYEANLAAHFEKSLVFDVSMKQSDDLEDGLSRNEPVFMTKLNVTKENEGTYYLKFYEKYLSNVNEVEAALSSQLENSKFDGSLKGRYSFEKEGIPQKAYDIMWTLSADENHLKSEANLNCDGKNCFMILNVDRSKVYVNSNMFKPFSFLAKVKNENEKKSFEITSLLDETKFAIGAEMTQYSVKGNIVFKELNGLFNAEIFPGSGFDFLLQISPTQRYAFNWKYSLSRGIYLRTGYETPIKGWEKLELELSVDNSNRDFNVRANLTDSNDNKFLGSLDLKGFYDYNGNKIVAFSIDSSIPKLEKISLFTEYVNTATTHNVNILGEWNGEVIRGNAKAQRTFNGYDSSFVLDTPLTDVISGHYSHQIHDNEISASLDYIFKTAKSKMLAKAIVVDRYNFNGNVKIYSPVLPEITLNVDMKNKNFKNNLEIIGRWNSNKLIVSANCDHIKDCKAQFGITTETSKLISLRYASTIDSNEDLDVVVDLYTPYLGEKTNKVHFKGNYISINDFKLSGAISSSKINGQIIITHSIVDSKLSTDLYVKLNDKLLNVKGKGTVSPQVTELNGEIMSTCEILNGNKIYLIHGKEDHMYVTRVKVSKDDLNIDVTHKHLDSLNWKNSIKVNDVFKMENELTRMFEELKLISMANYKDTSAELKYVKQGASRSTFGFALNSSFMSNGHINLTYDVSHHVNMIDIDLKYGKNTLVTTIKRNPDENSKLFDFDLQLNQIGSLVLNCQKKIEVYKIAVIGQLNTKVPRSFMAKFSKASNKRLGYLEYVSYDKYVIDYISSVERNSGIITLNAVLPGLFDEALTSTVKIEKGKKYIVSHDTQLGNKIYNAKMTLGSNDLVLEAQCSDQKSKLSAIWNDENGVNNVEIEFSSTVSTIPRIFISAEYTDMFDGKINLKYGEKEWSVFEKVTGKTAIISIETPITNWETLKLNVNYDDSSFDIKTSKNKEEITIIGSGVLKTLVGEGELKVSTPFSGYEFNSASLKYASENGEFKVEGKVSVGSKFIEAEALSHLTSKSRKTSIKIESNVDSTGVLYVETIQDSANFAIKGLLNEIELTSKVTYNVNDANFHVKYSFDSNIKNIENVDLDCQGILVNGQFPLMKKLKLDFNLNHITLHLNLDRKTHKIELSLENLEFVSIKNLSFQFMQENHEAELELNVVTDLEHEYLVKGTYKFEEFSVIIQTPFENYKKMAVKCNFKNKKDVISFVGKVVYNDQIYEMEGQSTLLQNGNIGINVRLSQGDAVLQIKSQFSLMYSQISVIRNYRVIFDLSHFIKDNSIVIKMDSDLKSFSHGEIKCTFEKIDNAWNIKLIGQKNSDHIEVAGIVEALGSNNYDSQFSLKIPSLQKEFGLQTYFNYDKTSGILKSNLNFKNVKNSDESFSIDLLLNKYYDGYFKISNSFYTEKVFKFDYKVNIENYDEREALFTLQLNADKYQIGARQIYKNDEAVLKFFTPFAGYERIGFEGVLKPVRNEYKLNFEIGSATLGVAAKLKSDDILLSFQTPFETLKKLEYSLKYDFNSKQKYLVNEFVLNDYVYLIEGGAKFSLFDSNLSFKIISPLDFLKIVDIKGKLNLDSATEFLNIRANYNHKIYAFVINYRIGNYKVMFDANMRTPIENWTDVKLFIHFDLHNPRKILNVAIEKEGVQKALLVIANLEEYEVEIHAKLPETQFNDFKAKGTVNRAKRSIDFKMMRDHHDTGIILSFNKIKISATTPFEKAKDIHFEMSKTDDAFHFEYKRNNNKVYVTVDISKKKGAVGINIESQIPAWELLAVLGRIDLEEGILYLTGKKNSDMIQISGSGSFGAKTGSLTIKSTSAYKDYAEVETIIEYNARRNIFRFDSQSKSSDFKIIFEIKQGLHIEIFVPNAKENTVVNGKLTPFKGSLTASSRFKIFKTFSVDYQVKLGPIITIDFNLERNGLKILEIEFKRDSKANTAHLMMHGRSGENHSQLHFHREGWKSLEFSFNRNGKELKINLKGTGNLPKKGKLEFNISNSFRAVKRTITGYLDVDRTSDQKLLKFKADSSVGHYYTAELKYKASLSNLKKGEFEYKHATSRRIKLKDVAGSWNLEDKNNAEINLRVGPRVHTLKGKLGIKEMDATLKSTFLNNKILMLKWKFSKVGYERDHYLKVGFKERFVMIKLKGSIQDIFNGDVNGAFRASRFMKHDFEFSSKWSRSSAGLSGGGKFAYGNYRGTHTLTKLKRNWDDKAMDVNWDMTSNIEGMEKVKLIGGYNLGKKTIDMKLIVGKDEWFIKGAINDFDLEQSKNTVVFNLPKFGKGELTFSHNFKDPLSVTAKINGYIGEDKVKYVLKRTRNADFTKVDLNLNIDSSIFGTIVMNGNYDITNIDNAKSSLSYTRNDDKFVDINWYRIKTDTNLKAEWTFKTHFGFLQSGKIYLFVDWSDDFDFKAGAIRQTTRGEREIKITFNVGKKETVGLITTPYSGFRKTSLKITYELLGSKSRVATFKYQRGDKVVEAEVNLQTPEPKVGSLNFILKTPFEFLKQLSVEGKWENGQLVAKYQRNDVVVDITGEAIVRTGDSSFDVKFKLPSGKDVELKIKYDIMNFIRGDDDSPKELIDFHLHIEDHHIEFKAKGYRTSEHLYIELHGDKTFGIYRKYHIKLNSGLNLSNRKGELEIQADDFHLKVKNSFEKTSTGYYARSHIISSATKLPGFIMGFGRDGESFIITAGFGDEDTFKEDREMTITLNAKDHFKKGFGGTLSFPRLKIENLKYDISYNFLSEDILSVSVKIEVKDGEFIEADITYNSSGVKSRLSTPWTGLHSIRVRRSLTRGNFVTDIGLSNYGVTYETDGQNLKKGIRVQAMLFGQEHTLVASYDIKNTYNSEAKFLIYSPYFEKKNAGIYYKMKSDGKNAKVEVKTNLFFDLDLNADVKYEKDFAGDLSVNFNGLKYNVNCDLKRINSNELKGFALISTPHDIIKELSLNGNIFVVSEKDFKIKFSIIHSSIEYTLTAAVNLVGNVYKIDAQLLNTNGLNLIINSDYSLQKKPLYLHGSTRVEFNGDSLLLIISEISYKSSRNLFIKKTVTVKDYFNGVIGVIVNKNIKGEMQLKTLSEPSVGVKFSMEKEEKKGLMELSYIGLEEYSIAFNIDKERDRVNYALNAVLPKILISEIKVSKEIGSYSRYLGFSAKRNLKFSADVDFIHFSKSFKTGGEVIISGLFNKLAIDFNERKVFLLSHDARQDNFKFLIGTLSKYLEKLSLDLGYSSVNPKLEMFVKSLALPSGVGKFNAEFKSLSSYFLEEVKLLLAYGSRYQNYLAEFHLKNGEKESNLKMEIKLPEYYVEKMNFEIKYKVGDLKQIFIIASPFDVRATAVFGVEDSTFVSKIDVNTEVENYKRIKAQAIIPLNKLNPSFMANINGKEYGIKVLANTSAYEGDLQLYTKNILHLSKNYSFSYRTKAPYKIAFENILGAPKFGIIFDSSLLPQFKYLY